MVAILIIMKKIDCRTQVYTVSELMNTDIFDLTLDGNGTIFGGRLFFAGATSYCS